MLLEGRDAISEIPGDRIDLSRFFDERPATPGRMMTRWGGFLSHIHELDAAFFGIAPVEAECMDPHQRLLLETAWEALEDAGEDIAALEGTNAAVFMGQWTSDFENRVFSDPDLITFPMTMGSGRYGAAARLSYVLGLRGPCLSIDAACSSGLACVHLAVQSLRAGECELALAGGANLILQPHIHIAYSQSRMMAPDGRCKFGDASGNGYVRSEGVGVVVLKSLDKAQHDGDHIYAVIRGSAVNNDGRSSGSMGRPSRIGQVELLQRAYADADVAPAAVGYVEAHGTGTRAGDPVELGALSQVLGEGREPGRHAWVGSIKTNIGHTEATAGIAGLIKAALVLRNGAIPPSLHFNQPNPTIPWAELPLKIATQVIDWPKAEGAPARFASVSAYGIGGTNAHVVLEEAPALLRAPSSTRSAAANLLVLSARSPESLRVLARRYSEWMDANPEVSLEALCWNAATRRTGLSHRASFVSRNSHSLAESLRDYADDFAAVPAEVAADVTPKRVCFVVPGQGAQWLGMARELAREQPVFREALEQCDRAMQPYTDWSLVEQLAANPGDGTFRLEQIDVIQPVLVAIAIAYAHLWRSLGIEPAAVVGHSMGEVGAAYIAGVLDLGQAMRIICRRSALMRRTSGQGAMALVDLSMDDARARLRGREAAVSVAVSNSPHSSVISGAPNAVSEVITELERDGIFCRLVRVDVASHSPQMEPLARELLVELADLQPHAERTCIVSTVLARKAEGSEFDAGYWARNLRQPVMFSKAVSALIEEGMTTFIELGPHPVLLQSIEQTALASGVSATAIACGRREEPEVATFLAAVGAAWCAGLPVDWTRLMADCQSRLSLPQYPWQRERLWTEAASQTAAAGVADAARSAQYPLLERRFDLAADGAVCWETTLAPTRFGWIADHRVRGSTLFPGAAYCEVALAAAAESRSARRWALAHVEFLTAWTIPSGTSPRLQVRLQWSGENQARFDVYGRGGDEEERWERRATGVVVPADNVAPVMPMSGHVATVSHEDLYAMLDEAGLGYGPAFRGIRELTLGDAQGVASVQLDMALLDPRARRYKAFPPVLDAALQAIAGAILQRELGEAATPIPTRIARLELLRPLPADAAFTVTFAASSGDADIHDAHGEWFAAVRGVVFERLGKSAAGLDAMLRRAEWVDAGPIPEATEIGPVIVVCPNFATAQTLMQTLAAKGVRSVHVPTGDAVQSALAALAGETARAQIVHMGALECAGPGDRLDWIEEAWRQTGDDTLALVRGVGQVACGVPARVWLVTRGAVSTSEEEGVPALGGSALWGLGRVWAHEQPGLDVTLVDIEADGSEALAALIRAQPLQRQLALRGGRWMRLRLTAWQENEEAANTADAPSLRAEISSPGEPDSLHWQAALRPVPSPHEVEIEVAHAGLNFMNLMSALGVYPGYESGRGPLGIECAGRVVRVGALVTNVRPGDEVIAIGHGCLQKHALVHGDLAVPKPRSLASDAAAGTPIAFLTAIYALEHLARIKGGERVLVHSAAGGVGLAALQVIRRAGAEVLATAGTEEKRALLRSMGVAHVFDSRGDFASAVLAATNGRGVDIVLNSLAGDAITAGLGCLAPYGRFVELGKRDIYGGTRMELSPFRTSLAYFAVDLDRMMRDRSALLGQMLRELMADFEAEKYHPLPTKTYAGDDLVVAFKDLMPGTHVGKHVVALEPVPARVRTAPYLRSRIRGDGCHVVSGGLGALGLEVARWLARRGAGTVMLLGRGAPTPAVQRELREIEVAGTRVLTAECDVADREMLAAVLERARREVGPLRGVFHAAGTLADVTLGEMTPETLRAPRDGKVLGAWNLDRLTEADSLDAFVMFSSVASLFGTPGQGNYAAANAFLDALAQHRQARGKPGLAVAFGPVAAVGLAAVSAVRGDSLRRLGFVGIEAATAIEAVDRLIAVGAAHAVCAEFDARRWNASLGREDVLDLVDRTEAAIATREAEPVLRDALAAIPPGPPRRALMESAIKADVGAVLRMAPQRVPSDRALKSLGLDSLMALELRNRLEKRCGSVLSPTLAWNYPTVLALAEHLAERLHVALDAAAGPAPPLSASAADSELDALIDDIEQMSDEEARALLNGVKPS